MTYVPPGPTAYLCTRCDVAGVGDVCHHCGSARFLERRKAVITPDGGIQVVTHGEGR